MEFRKLISFGKSSFVVSLPKAWVTKNKIAKGDLIAVEENGPKLILSKQLDESKEEEEKEIIILIDGKDEKEIVREACSAYIQNFRKIQFKGKELKGKVAVIQKTIQNLMALEVMEQLPESIVAKDFLNMNKVSPMELIRKMDIVTRTMIRETMDILDSDNFEAIDQRDKDVNRLFFLLYRSILYLLENPTKTHKLFGFSSQDLVRMREVGFYIENVADEIRDVARYARLLKLPAKRKEKLKTFLLEIEAYYIKTLKAIHKNDISSALAMAKKRIPMDKTLREFDEWVLEYKHLHRVLSALQRIIIAVHNVGRVTYTLVPLADSESDNI